jgi:hypothetical protein
MSSARPRSIHLWKEDESLPSGLGIQVATLPGVHLKDGAPQISSELVTEIPFGTAARNFRYVNLRGLDAIGFAMHHVTLKEGVLPRPGQVGVVLGRRQAGQFVGFRVGQNVWIGGERWPVIGVMDAGGVHDSELWCDRQALAAALHHQEIEALTVSLDESADPDAFIRAVKRLAIKGLRVEPDQAYFAGEMASKYHLYDSGLSVIASLAFLLVALVGACLAARCVDIAGVMTLLRRGMAGAGLGVISTTLAHGREVVFLQDSTRFDIVCSLRVYAVAAGLSLLLLLFVLVLGVAMVRVRRSAPALRRVAALGLVLLGLTASGVLVTVSVAYKRTLIGARRSVAYKPGICVMSKRLFADTLPFEYVEPIKQFVRGRWPVHWFNGIHIDAGGDLKRPLPIMAISEDCLDVFGPDQTRPPPAEYADWHARRDGVILIGTVKEETGWRPGKRVVLHVGNVDLAAVVSGSAGGQEGGFAPNKVLMHYDYVNAHVPAMGSRVAIIGVTCGADDERLLIDQLEALFARSPEPVNVITQAELLDYDLSESSLRSPLESSSIPISLLVGVLLFCAGALFFDLGGARLSWLLVCAAVALVSGAISFLVWRQHGIHFGEWVLANVIVTRPMAAMGVALSFLLSTSIGVTAARWHDRGDQ